MRDQLSPGVPVAQEYRVTDQASFAQGLEMTHGGALRRLSRYDSFIVIATYKGDGFQCATNSNKPGKRALRSSVRSRLRRSNPYWR